jgi:hypothetical protein
MAKVALDIQRLSVGKGTKIHHQGKAELSCREAQKYNKTMIKPKKESEKHEKLRFT